ncbi:carboxylesterase, partial [Erwinia sp. B116]
LEQPVPSVAVLNGGLEILRSIDLRAAMSGLTLPQLRLYGALDGLVPRAIAPLLDALWPASRSHLFSKAAHAPFISHPDAFCEQVSGFCNQIDVMGVN